MVISVWYTLSHNGWQNSECKRMSFTCSIYYYFSDSRNQSHNGRICSWVHEYNRYYVIHIAAYKKFLWTDLVSRTKFVLDNVVRWTLISCAKPLWNPKKVVIFYLELNTLSLLSVFLHKKNIYWPSTAILFNFLLKLN